MLTGLNEYGRLKRVAMRRPADAMIDQATIDREWRDLNYHTAPDFKRAVAEHAPSPTSSRASARRSSICRPTDALTMDSLYVRDAAMVCPRGVILCNMGKPAREGEPAIHGKRLRAGRHSGDRQDHRRGPGGGRRPDLARREDGRDRPHLSHQCRGHPPVQGHRRSRRACRGRGHAALQGPERRVPPDVGDLAARPRPAAGLFAADADPVPRMAGGRRACSWSRCRTRSSPAWAATC